jgi:hypothetical protein
MTSSTPPRTTGGSIVDSSKQFLKEGSSRLRALFIKGNEGSQNGNTNMTSPSTNNNNNNNAVAALSTTPSPNTTNNNNNSNIHNNHNTTSGDAPKRKRSIFGQTTGGGGGGGGGDKLDPSSIEAHLITAAKERNTDVNEVIKTATISSPYDVEHKVKVRFDEQNIRYSGIPEGWAAEAHRQFGIPLPTCPRIEVAGYADRIPLVLCKLRERFIELDGPRTEGVFRLAPDGQDVTDVKNNINTGQALASLQTTKDPHVVANLIKQFYRELQPKILSTLSKEAILEMAPINDHTKIAAYIKQLPEPNQSVFLWLLDLLCDVAAHQEINRMTPTNLAIVVSPNLYDAGAGTEPIEELMLSQKVAAVACNALKWRIASRGM